MYTNSYSKSLFGFLLIVSLTSSLFLTGCGKPGNESVNDGESHSEAHAADAPSVIVSTTDLMGIVEAVAGDLVKLHCFGKGNQDPHDLDILPSYVREMNDADLWIQVGNDIEAAWYPDLMANVTNPSIVKGDNEFGRRHWKCFRCRAFEWLAPIWKPSLFARSHRRYSCR